MVNIGGGGEEGQHNLTDVGHPVGGVEEVVIGRERSISLN